MKVNFFHIVSAHFRTLVNAQSKKISFYDICIFFLMPAAFSFFVYYKGGTFSNDVFGQSIAVFAIFSALLFSVQIALFGIFERARPNSNKIQKSLQEENLNMRSELIREANTNISYLIILSCISVTVFLLFFILEISDRFEPSVATFLYIHFMMTLLMIIKRVHALFQREYDIS